jgi:hypothetical protein
MHRGTLRRQFTLQLALNERVDTHDVQLVRFVKFNDLLIERIGRLKLAI